MAGHSRVTRLTLRTGYLFSGPKGAKDYASFAEIITEKALCERKKVGLAGLEVSRSSNLPAREPLFPSKQPAYGIIVNHLEAALTLV